MRRLPTERSTACPFGPPAGPAHQPVQKVILPSGDQAWLVTRHDLVRQVLADTRFSSRIHGGAAGMPLRETTPEPGMLMQMDPPEHTRLRRKLTGHFTLKRMNGLRPRIEQLVADRLDALEKCPQPTDLVAEFALPIPSLVMCELLGVPYADRAEFQQTGAKVMSMSSTPEEIESALGRLAGYLTGLIGRKRAAPGDGLLDRLLDLGDEELVGLGLLLLIAGQETTANMLALGTALLLQHPDQLVLVRDDPTARTAVDELMRYTSLETAGLLRTATADVEVGGVTIAAGDFVNCSLASANRDPQLCERPDELDVTRQRTPHVGFGFGPHQCLGQNLARLQMEVAFPALLRRLPGLRLAVPLSQVRFKHDTAFFGVHELPVEWGRDGTGLAAAQFARE